MKFLRALPALLFCSHLITHADTAEPNQLSYGQWYGALGGAGLRRSLANMSDQGELANRITTYRLSKQQERIYLSQVPAPTEPFVFESETVGNVAQLGTFSEAPALFGRHTAIEGMLRVNDRQDDALSVFGYHLDLGLLWSANIFSDRPGYFSVNGIWEHSDADVSFVNGQRKGDSYGARVQFGEVLDDTWAYSFKLERTWFSGEGFSYRPSGLGPVRVSQDVDSTRTYLNLDIISRALLADFIIPNAQWYWRSGFYYLQFDYEDQINSLGQPASEPFGPTERLGFLRTGGQLTWRYGSKDQWSPFTEFLYDYEVVNNLDDVFSEPHSVSVKLGLAWLPKRGDRYQLEAQRYQGLDNERNRNNITLTVLLDYWQ